MKRFRKSDKDPVVLTGVVIVVAGVIIVVVGVVVVVVVFEFFFSL